MEIAATVFHKAADNMSDRLFTRLEEVMPRNEATHCEELSH
jgi:hypothetical protein